MSEPRVGSSGRRPAIPWAASMMLLALALLVPVAANADGAYLVRDIDLTGEPYFPECHILCPPAPALQGSLPYDLVPLGDEVLFVANDHAPGFAPWISDGTAAGTRKLADLPPEFAGVPPIIVGAAGGYGLFWPASFAGDLWITDGTEAGTEPLALPCGNACEAWGGQPGWTVEGQLFFSAYDGGAKHVKLYRFDPAARTTHEVFDACSDRPGTFCIRDALEVTSWDGDIYFNVGESGSGGSAVRLHWMDGPAGTPSPAAEACNVSASLLPLGSQLLFTGNCGLPSSQRSLFSLDGPDAVPQLVHGFAAASRLTAWGDDRAAFTEGSALWITDGTTAGTTAAGFELAAWFAPLGDVLLVYGARAGVVGLYALPRSGNTTLLREGLVREPGVVGGVALFSAESPGSGFELWMTDGTPAGTRLLQDLAPGPASSNPGDGGIEPTGFVAAGDRAYFAASDPQHDIELWAVPLEGLAPTACQSGPETLCLSGRFRVEVSWKDFSGNSGRGRAVPLPGVTGAFWFFDASNLEVMVKVLDGRALNGSYWVFYGALSNVEFTLTVTDTETGLQWSHHNPSGHFASGADTSAFPE